MKTRVVFLVFFNRSRISAGRMTPEQQSTSASDKLHGSRWCDAHPHCNGLVQLRDPGSANRVVREKGLFIGWEKGKGRCPWDRGAKPSTRLMFEMWGLRNTIPKSCFYWNYRHRQCKRRGQRQTKTKHFSKRLRGLLVPGR